MLHDAYWSAGRVLGPQLLRQVAETVVMMAAVMTGEVTSYQVAASCFVLGHTPLVAADWYLRAPELRILYTRAYTTMLEESIAAYKKFTTNNVNRSQLLRDGIYLAHELRTEDSLFRRTNAGTGPTVVHTYDISYHIHEPMDAVSERVGGFHVPSHPFTSHSFDICLLSSRRTYLPTPPLVLLLRVTSIVLHSSLPTYLTFRVLCSWLVVVRRPGLRA